MKLATLSNLYPRPDQTGRGLFNYRLFDALARNGDVHELHNFCVVPEWRPWKWGAVRKWTDPCDPALKTSYVPVFYVPVVGRNMSGRTYDLTMRAFRSAARDCDAILATWLYPDCVASARIARKEEKPLWLKVHGSDRFHLQHPARARAIAKACDIAAGVICNCRFLAGELEAAGVAEDKLHVVRNGVDSSVFHYRGAELAAAHSDATGARTVLFVGNLVPVKGPDILFRAFAGLADSMSGKAVRLVVVGSGPMMGQLLKLARELRIGDNLDFIGQAEPEETALWMNRADVLCVPSRSEGMPNVVNEALASGLPVVASDVGGISEVVVEGTNGLLLDDEPELQPGTLRAALARALSTSWSRTDIGLSAPAHSWDVAAGQVVELMAS